MIGTIVTITIFFIYFPSNHSIEQSVTALKILYNGAIVLLGGVLAYTFFFKSSFSINDVLEKTMEEMTTSPFISLSPVQVSQEEWNGLTGKNG